VYEINAEQKKLLTSQVKHTVGMVGQYKLRFATYGEEKLSNLNDFKHNFFKRPEKLKYCSILEIFKN
jgi:hypothetical protein